ncbi:DUF4112 domain-containing protein [Microcoleus vaginatus PCC 9802]|uniref:DUF4112 domain-containing protein n=1 Tax=Microcoleus vaginatus TaxID=119532 RepID=UPI00020D2634|nr:hypothetical protein MicvaDRAFT_5566 [Microcoleus vaginatus FGP-2]UNU18750.1 DUF4112 domain-containing protein [Microcoleus vaginatus PCC 9802]
MSRSPIQNSSANTPNKSHVASLRRLRRISHLLDNAIPIPGTKYRIGLDPILGLIPGGGDLISSLFAGYVVFKSAQMGVPQETLVKMATNIVFDTVAGTVPVAGDLLDVTWKANVKNIELLDAHLGSPEPGKKANWLFVAALLLGLMLIVGGVIFLSVMLFGWLFRVVTGR